MAQITAELVKTLREKTNVGMMECKSALTEADFTAIQTYSNFVVSELMYHPVPDGTNYADEDFEYIEFTNTGTNVLAAGDYVLITNTSGSISGSFAGSPVISGAGLGVGLAGTVVTSGNSVTLHVAASSSGPPVITSTLVIGSDLIISGTNSSGTAGGTYYVRATNYVAIPMASWPRISTNTYGVGGAFSVTNAVNPAVPVRFFRIEE